MTCPDCGEVDAAAEAGAIAVCGQCGMTCLAGRQATFEDIRVLAEDEIQALRRARGRIVRPAARQKRA